MTKRFNFGKIDYNHSGRKNCVVEVEIKYEQEHNSFYDKEFMEFTAIGFIYNPKHTNCYAGGQCLDTIKKFIPDNDIFNRIYTIWKRYHLNGLHAGTPEQESALNKHFNEIGERYDYRLACDYLKSINLYEVEINGKPYKYGHSWLCEEIPENIQQEIESLFTLTY